MQHTRDKEFDNLFKDKLMDAEMEPNANLWINIEAQLAPKPRRKLPVFWIAAASVAVVIAAVLMLQQKETLYVRGNTTNATNLHIPVDTLVLEKVTASKPLAKSVNNKTLTHANINLSGIKVNDGMVGNVKDTLGMQPNTQIARLPIKQAIVKPLEVIDVAPTNTSTAQSEIAFANTDDYTDQNKIEEPANTDQRKGIRNIGDLVNFVVDKVDKRERKLIKFNTDDDNSSISAINIGFIKLNKRSRAER